MTDYPAAINEPPSPQADLLQRITDMLADHDMLAADGEVHDGYTARVWVHEAVTGPYVLTCTPVSAEDSTADPAAVIMSLIHGMFPGPDFDDIAGRVGRIYAYGYTGDAADLDALDPEDRAALTSEEVPVALPPVAAPVFDEASCIRDHGPEYHDDGFGCTQPTRYREYEPCPCLEGWNG